MPELGTRYSIIRSERPSRTQRNSATTGTSVRNSQKKPAPDGRESRESAVHGLTSDLEVGVHTVSLLSSDVISAHTSKRLSGDSNNILRSNPSLVLNLAVNRAVESFDRAAELFLRNIYNQTHRQSANQFDKAICPKKDRESSDKQFLSLKQQMTYLRRLVFTYVYTGGGRKLDLGPPKQEISSIEMKNYPKWTRRSCESTGSINTISGIGIQSHHDVNDPIITQGNLNNSRQSSSNNNSNASARESDRFSAWTNEGGPVETLSNEDTAVTSTTRISSGHPTSSNRSEQTSSTTNRNLHEPQSMGSDATNDDDDDDTPDLTVIALIDRKFVHEISDKKQFGKLARCYNVEGQNKAIPKTYFDIEELRKTIIESGGNLSDDSEDWNDQLLFIKGRHGCLGEQVTCVRAKTLLNESIVKSPEEPLFCPVTDIIQEGVRNLWLFENRYKVTLRAYLLCWNGRLFLSKLGYAVIHVAKSYSHDDTDFAMQIGVRDGGGVKKVPFHDSQLSDTMYNFGKKQKDLCMGRKKSHFLIEK